NWLEIVATNSGKTYTLTRELVYYAGTPTAFDMVATYTSGGNTVNVRLDGNPTVDINASEVKISGKLAFPKPNPMPNTKPDIDLEIYWGTQLVDSLTTADSEIVVGNPDTSDTNFVVFPFEIDTNNASVDFTNAYGIYTI